MSSAKFKVAAGESKRAVNDEQERWRRATSSTMRIASTLGVKEKKRVEHAKLMQSARAVKEQQETARRKIQGFGSTLTRFPNPTSRNMVGMSMESGDAGEYLQWDGHVKPRCGGLGFSFNDHIRARHHTTKGTGLDTADRPSAFALPKRLAEDLPNYSYYERAATENKKAWNRRFVTVPRLQRFHTVAQAHPVPSVGSYEIDTGDVRDKTSVKTNWKTKKVPHIPFGSSQKRKILVTKKTDPSPSMTQYNIV